MELHLWQPIIPSTLGFASQLSVVTALTRLHFNEGEKRLMQAVLLDALGSIERYSVRKGAQNWGKCQEALQWVLAHDRHWPFSFENICSALDLDADRLRSTLSAEFPMLFLTEIHADTFRPKVLVNLRPVRG
jgi:uncharacterized alpha-E superfamily protein